MTEVLVSFVEVIIAVCMLWFAVEMYAKLPQNKVTIVVQVLAAVLFFALGMTVLAGAVYAVYQEFA